MGHTKKKIFKKVLQMLNTLTLIYYGKRFISDSSPKVKLSELLFLSIKSVKLFICALH